MANYVDTGANIAALTPAQLSALAPAFDGIDANDDVLILSLAQFNALGPLALTPNDLVTVSDTASALSSLTAAQLTALSTKGVDVLEANDGTLVLTAAKALALGNMTLSPSGTAALVDTGTAINALTATQIGTLSAKGLDSIDATSDVLTLSVAKFNALGSIALSSGDLITLADSSTNLNALNAAQIANMAAAGIDIIDSTNNALSLTVDEFYALGTIALTAGDVITLADTGANIQLLTAGQLTAIAAKGVDRIDATNNVLSLTLEQLGVFNASFTLTASDTVTLTESGATIGALGPSALAALIAKGVDRLDATDNVLALSYDQYVALGTLALTSSDIVTLSIDGTVLAGLAPTQITAISTKGIDILDVTGGPLTLDAARATALGAMVFAPTVYVTLADTGEAIATLTATQIASLATKGLDAIDATNDQLTMTAAKFNALGAISLSAGDLTTLADTGAAITALTAAQIATLSGKGLDRIDASDDQFSLTVAEYNALGGIALTSGDVVTIADTGAAIAALSAGQITAMGAAGIDRFDASNNALLLTVAQYSALGLITLNSADVITLADAGSAISALSETQIAALSANGIDRIDATDNALTLSLAQFNALGTVTLTTADVVTLADGGTALAALSVPQIAALAGKGIDRIDSSDGALTLNIAQYGALGTVALTASDFVTLSDTAADIQGLSATQLTALSTKGFDVLEANDGPLSLTAAKAVALGAMTLAPTNPVTIFDTGTAISALSSTQLATLATKGLDAIDASDNALTLTVAKFAALGSIALAGDDVVTIADTSAALNALTATQIAAMASAGVDVIDSTGNTLAWTVEKVQALGNIALVPIDVVTLTDSGANIQALDGAGFAALFVKGIDRIDATDGAVTLNVDQFIGLGAITLTTADTVILADTGAALSALSAAQFATLSGKGFDRIDATDNALTLALDQYNALGTVALTASDFVTLSDSASSIQGLSPLLLTALSTKGFDILEANDGPLTLSAAQALALGVMALSPTNAVTLEDTTSAINALTAAQITTLATKGFDKINSSEDALTLTVAEFNALGGIDLSEDDVVTIADSSTALNGLTAIQIAAMAAAGVDVIDSTNNALAWSVEKVLALGTIALVPFDIVTLTDAGGAIQALSRADLEAMSAKGISKIDATDGAVTLTVDQFLGLGSITLTTADAVILADTGTALSGLSAAQIATLAGKGFDRIDASDNAFTLSLDQYNALGTVALTAADTVTLTAAAGSLANLSPAAITALSTKGIDVLDVSGGTLALSAAHALALGNITLSPSSNVVLTDTATAINALSATQIATLAAKGLDGIDSNTDQLTLTVSEYTSLGSIALTQDDVVTIADTATNLQALTGAQIAGLAPAGIDVIDSTSNTLLLTVDQYRALSSAALTAADVVTLADTGANIQSLTLAELAGLSTKLVDRIDATDNALTLSLAQYSAIGSVALTATDVVTIADDATAIQALTPTELTALSTKGLDILNATSGTLALDAAQALALGAMTLAPAGTAALVDTGAAISALSSTQIATLATKGLGSIDATNDQLTLTVAKFNALGSIALSPGDTVTLSDSSTTLNALSTTQISAMAAAGVDVIDSTNNALSLTFADFNALGMIVLTAGDAVTLADTGAVIQGLSAADFATLIAKGFDTIDATDGAYALSLQQFNALGTLALTASDTVTLLDDAAALSLLAPANLTALSAKGIDVLAATGGSLSLSVVQALALANISLAPSTTTTLRDTGAAIGGLSASQIGTLAAKGLDAIDANGSLLTLTVAKFNALGGIALSSGDIVTIADSSTALNALTAAQIAAMATAGVDVIDSTTNTLTLTAQKAQALGPIVLASGDLVTLTDTGANIQLLTPAELANLAANGLDRIDATDNLLALSVAQFNALGLIQLTAGDAVTLVDTGTAIQSLASTDFSALIAKGFGSIDATDGAYSLSLAQYNALGTLTLSAGDVVTLSDSSAAISGLNTTQIAALSAKGIDILAATDGALSLTVAQASALGSLSVAQSTTFTLSDVGGAIAALSPAEFGTLGAKGLDSIDATDDQLALSLAQYNALGSVALTAGDIVALSDTGAAIAGLGEAGFAALAGKGIDVLDATDNAYALSLAQFNALGSLGLAAGDVVTISEAAASIQALSAAEIAALAAKGIDVIDAGGGSYTISLAQYNALGSMTLATGDTVTLTGSSAGLASLTPAELSALSAKGVDILSATDGALELSAAQAQALGTVQVDAANDLTIIGDGASETISGHAGDGTITGGGGADTMAGGGGADVFVFAPASGIDQITDFNFAAGDRIDVSAYGYNSLSAITNAGGSVAVVAGDTIIDFNGTDRVTLAGFDINAIGNPAQAFIFDNSLNVIQGTPGDDNLIGTAGNDLYLPGYNLLGDNIHASAGSDTIDFIGAGPNGGWYPLYYGEFGYPVDLNVTIGATTGTIVKQGIGTDTLLNLDAIDGNEGGLGLDAGTGGNDTFTIDTSGVEFIEIGLGGGNDSVTGTGTGTLRLRFDDYARVNLDAAQGTAFEIGGTSSATFSGVSQFMGGAGNDSFVGSSANEQFQTGASGAGGETPGTANSVDGGGGFDTVRYDRPGVTNLSIVYSAQGSAIVTGNWNGQDFEDTLTNVEAVRGARTSTTQFTGSDGHETFIARGGTNTFESGGGNDTLQGFVIGRDKIDLSAFGFTSTADLADISFDGFNTLIDIGSGNTIIVKNVNLETADPAQVFIFASGPNIIQGTPGNDNLTGTAGDDLYLPGNTTSSGTDQVQASGGNDTIDFSGAGSIGGFYALAYWTLPQGTGLNINIGATSGTIVKQGIGVDTLVNLDQIGGDPFGMGIYLAQNGNDTINVDTSGVEYLEIGLKGGTDTVAGTGTGTLRLWFDDYNGVSVNAELGTATEINGTSSVTFNGATQFQGSSGNDIFVGSSADEMFITGSYSITPAGTANSVDGGGGRDTVRYDRQGVADLNIVYSAQGSAIVTGIWNGEAFTDTLTNVEVVRGARASTTQFTGSSGDETFDARGGTNTFESGGGNDTFEGFRVGFDKIDFSEFNLGDTSGFADFTYDGFNTTIDLGANGTITVTGVDLTAADPEDVFIFDDNLNVVQGTPGDEVLVGTDGDDLILPGDATPDIGDEIRATLGNDEIDFDGSVDGYYGLAYWTLGDGVDLDVTIGAASGTIVKGGLGTDTLTNLDQIDGTAGGLGLYAGFGGNDSYDINTSGIEYIFLSVGGGDDTLQVSGNGYMDVDLSSYDGVTVDANLTIGTVTETSGSSSLDVTGFVNQWRGTTGNDSFTGTNGGENFITQGGDNTVNGGGGFDLVRYDRNGVTNLSVVYSAQGSAIATGIWNGEAFTDILTDVEAVRGARTGVTQFTGSDGDETFIARGGYSVFEGGGGNDTLNAGGNGNLFIFGADSGVDTISSFVVGRDRIDLTAFGIADTASFLTGSVTYVGVNTLIDLGGGNTITVNGANLTIEDPADVFVFAANPNTVQGTAGNDTLVGDSTANLFDGLGGNDTIYGLGGNDTIAGGDGVDKIEGGKGNDGLAGGTGGDLFIFAPGSGTDTIADFDFANGDRIDASAYGVISLADLSEFTFDGDDTIIGFDANNSVRVIGVDLTALAYPGQIFGRIVQGTANDDDLLGGDGDDIVLGLEGNDYIDGGAGNDLIDGGQGTFDTANYGNAAAAITVDLTRANGQVINDGEGGTDTLLGVEMINGSNFNDTVTGNANDNSFFGFGGNDTFNGGAGGDYFEGGAGNDFFDGGDWYDTISYNNAASGITVDLTLELGQITDDGDGGADTILNVETVSGSNHADNFLGNDADNQFLGNGGDDFIDGGNGFDNISHWTAQSGIVVDLANNQVIDDGQGGTDTLVSIENVQGSQFDDTITGDNNNNTLNGEDGDDTLNGGEGDDFLSGGAGNDTIDGGVGFDNLAFFGAFSGVTVNLGAATNQVSNDGSGGFDTAVNIEGVFGSGSDDNITGNADANSLSGWFGNDTLNGEGGNDNLNGEDGDDTLNGGEGDDFLSGGAGNDTIDGGGGFDNLAFFGAFSGITVNLGAATNQVSNDGSGGIDTAVNIEGVFGSGSDDNITGDAGANSLSGWFGNDTLKGEGGNDTLNGEDGDDTITGGAGDDFMQGGTGADKFVFGPGSGADNVFDFNFADGDRIDLTAYGYNSLSAISNAGGSISVIGADTIINLNGSDQIRLTGFDITTLSNQADLFIFAAGGLNVIQGTPGDDNLIGTNGNDLYLPGDSDEFGFEQLEASLGNDTYDFTGAGPNGGYYSIGYYAIGDGVGLTANIGQTGGTIIKQGIGTDTLVNLDLIDGNSGGFQIAGSNGGNDVFNVNSTGVEWFELALEGGDDTIAASGTGTFRVYFTGYDGVNLDAEAGTATEMNGGSSLTVTTGFIRQWFGTPGNDHMVGSSGDELFVTGRYGNETAGTANFVDGGGGFDVARYSRSGVTNLDVVYTAQGSAIVTGIWNGQAFTDTLVNVESVYGARADQTHFRGSTGDETFRAEGGINTFESGGGNDTFQRFVIGRDKIDLSELNLGDTSGFAGFTYDGTNTLIDLGANGTITVTGVDLTTADPAEVFIFDDNLNLVQGTPGNDTGPNALQGTAGNDLYLPGSTAAFGEDTIIASGGSDTIDFDGAGLNGGFYSLGYWSLLQGTGLNINIGATSGTIVKGGLGTDTLVNLNQVDGNLGGMGVYLAQDGDDTITVDTSGVEYLEIGLGGGTDTVTKSGTGILRLRFDDYDGVNVNASLGTATEIGGDASAIFSGATQFQGSAGNDSFIGSSANEMFITGSTANSTAGTANSVDGGGGFDLVRYDRNGVTNLSVVYSAQGSAVVTGVWNGEAFFDTLTNVEAVRGARTSTTQFLGSSGDETFVARGGINTFESGGGDDTFEGFVIGRDKIDLSEFNLTGTGDFADFTLVGGNTIIDLGANGTITVTGTDLVNADPAEVFIFDAILNLVQGTPGNDTGPGELQGTAGNDLYLPGSTAPGGGEDTILASEGSDTIDFANAGLNAGFYVLGYWPLPQGTGVNINIGATSGTIIKQGIGVDRLVNLEQVDGINGGMGIYLPQDGDDTIAVDTSGIEYLEIGLGGGIDTVTGTGNGTLRLRFDDYDGVNVNAALGTATEINGTSSATFSGVTQFQGSNQNDNFVGSDADENFMTGSSSNATPGSANSVDGGGGFDTVRYDRPGVINLSIVYSAPGSAIVTGAWNGQSFTDTLTNVEAVRGARNGVTQFTGSEGDETFIARGGYNIVEGGGGNDTLNAGGIGNLFVFGADSGVDTITGFVVDRDRIDVSALGIAGVAFSFEDGNTLIYLAGGNTVTLNGVDLTGVDPASVFIFDAIDGTSGDDAGATALDGTAANEALDGLGGNDELFGDGGHDVLRSGGQVPDQSGNDLLDGGAGNDVLIAEGGFVNLVGGQGNDTLVVNRVDDWWDSARADYSSSTGGITANLSGSGFNSVGSMRIADGLGGTDTVSGLYGIKDSAGNDSFRVDGSYRNAGGGSSIDIRLTTGNDTVNFTGAGGGARVNYRDAADGVIVDLASGTAVDANTNLANSGQDDIGTDTLVNVNYVRGSDFDDTLIGNDNDNRFRAHDGDDTIDGGLGIDEAEYSNSASGITVVGNLVTNDGFGSADTLTSIEIVSGSAHADNMTGDGSDNTFLGDFGNDTLSGNGGNDTLVGDFGDGGGFLGGDDILDGGEGDDTLEGGTGSDSLTGGIGGDLFVFRPGSGTDTIADFNFADGDRIDASDYGISSVADLDDFEFDGSDTIITFAPGNSVRIAGLDVTGFADDLFDAPQIVIMGTPGDDNLSGGDADETIIGLGGNDWIEGGAGDDSLDGGDGDDSLVGGSGDDFIEGGQGSFDTANYFNSPGAITVDLNPASNQVTNDGQGGADTLSNVEMISGSNFDDTVTGNGGDNFFFGNGGADIFYGGAGGDYFEGGAGNDYFDGGDWYDNISYNNATSGITVNLNLETGQISDDGDGGADTIVNVETVSGSIHADTFLGNDGDNQFIGNGGNDFINGGNGYDQVSHWFGGSGIVVDLGLPTGQVINDGQGGTDTLVSIESVNGSNLGDLITGDQNNNTLSGGFGNDTLNGAGGDDVISGDEGNDIIDGGDGFDNLAMGGAFGGVIVDLGAVSNQVVNDGWGGTDTVVNVEGVFGSFHNDSITGDGNANNFFGWLGNDTLNGAGGDDNLNGDFGDDTLNGGDGNDLLFGGADNDIVNGGDGNDNINGDDGNDTLNGGAGDDSLLGGAGSDAINGGDGIDSVQYFMDPGSVTVNLETGSATDGYGNVDTLTSIEVIRGSLSADTLIGDDVDNIISGNFGNDQIQGAGGNDQLLGEDGNDTLNGGAGDDFMQGGAGSDVFKFSDISSGSDVIVDFSSGEFDQIDLSSLFAGAGLPNSDYFTLTTNGNLSVVNGNFADIYGSNDAGTLDSQVYVDFDGTGGNERVLVVTVEDAELASGDFIV
jgi:Ca2+-binding RTX toxin-like protein